MSEADFKFIYGMEYFHRMFGRAIGVVFVGPALLFAAKGWLRGALAARVGLLFAAGGAQGLVGWWMVRSGLQARLAQIAHTVTFVRQSGCQMRGWQCLNAGDLVDGWQWAAGACNLQCDSHNNADVLVLGRVELPRLTPKPYKTYTMGHAGADKGLGGAAGKPVPPGGAPDLCLCHLRRPAVDGALRVDS